MRISITVPSDMAADLRSKADAAGISMSRIVYLRLRERGDIIVVGPDVLTAMREMTLLLRQIEEKGEIPGKEMAILERRVEFFASSVDFAAGSKKVKVFGKRGRRKALC